MLLRSYAKVNLCLAVSPPEPAGGPRAGWHRIVSWFHAIDLCDDIEIERADATAYERAWAADAPRPTPIDWPEEADLMVRAHHALEAHIGRALPIRLRARKRIPTGGGLAGGSSNAAAVLMGVAALYDFGLDIETLRALSRPLGSDVAYFLCAGDGPPAPALVSGFGAIIEPAAAASGTVHLVLPPFGCQTPAVYKAFDTLAPRPFMEDAARALSITGGAPREWESSLFNDLGPAAEAVEPRLANMRKAMERAGHRVHMTGSGSTLFTVGERAPEAFGGCVVVATRLRG
ncbi:MAG: hypothetical protein R3B68_14085 [Phycisphaerales bacterium]